MKKQKTRRERELGKVNKNLFWVGILVGMLIMLGTLIGFSIERNKIQDQLSECQEQVPVEPNPCFKFKKGVSMNTPEEMWNHGEGIVFPRDFIEVDCEVIE